MISPTVPAGSPVEYSPVPATVSNGGMARTSWAVSTKQPGSINDVSVVLVGIIQKDLV